jgi:hypothetical protein
VRHIQAARPYLRDADYHDLLHRFGACRTPEGIRPTREGLQEIEEVARAIEDHPVEPRGGGDRVWSEDAAAARRYREWILNGWPRRTRGIENPYGGPAFVDR